MATQYATANLEALSDLDDKTRRHVERRIADTYLRAERERVVLLAEAARYRELMVEMRAAEQAWRDHFHGDCPICSAPGGASCPSERALDAAADEAQRELTLSMRRLGLVS